MTTSLAEVIVTAQRRPENLQRTPVAVSVLSGADLIKQAVRTQEDLQRTVPGLIVRGTQDSNQINYAIRGQSVDAFSSSQPAVLTYVDEVQVDNGSSSAFYDLQSIQVLKGPQGTLFGRNATGGAVLFTTNHPTDVAGGYLIARGGNYGMAGVEGAVNLPLVDDKVLFRIAGVYQHRDGIETNLYDGAKVGSIDRSGVRASLVVKPATNFTNTLVVDYAHSGGTSVAPSIYSAYPPGTASPFVPANVLYSPGLDAAIGYPGAWNLYLAEHPKVDPAGVVAYAAVQRARGPYVVDLNAPLFHDANSVILSNVTLWDVAANTQLKNILGYAHISTNDSADIDGTPYGVEQTGPGGTIARTDQFSDELQLIGKTLDQKLAYVSGLYYADEGTYYRQPSLFLDLSPVIPVTPAIYENNTDNRSYAVYAQATYDLGSLTGVHGLGFTAGIRYTDEKVTLTQLPASSFYGLPNPPFKPVLSQDVGKVSWQLGSQYQVNPNLFFYVTGRHSFRSGGFNTNAAPLPGTAATGGAAFNPETTTDVELGGKFQRTVDGIPVRLNLDVYNQWIDGVQRSIYGLLLGQTGGFTINVPQAQVTGVEAEGQVNPAPWLSLGGNLAYTDGRFTNGHTILFGVPTTYGPYPDTPLWSGSAFAEVTHHMTADLDLSVRGDVFAQSSFYFSSLNNSLNPGSQLPGYALVDFRVALTDRPMGWTLAAYVKNAFNAVYYVGGVPIGSLFGFNTALPGDPRTYFVEASYRF